MRTDRPSSTALAVAASVVCVAGDARRGCLVSPQAARFSEALMRAYSPRAAVLADRLGRRWFRACAFALERLTLPGVMLHFVLRKRFLEDATRTALADGFRQVVVLGAGLDTLAMRPSAEFPQTAFIEVDHPTTQVVKRAAGSVNLALIAADLTGANLAATLNSHPAYRRAADTLVIAEGLLMYLTPEQVDRLFDQFRQFVTGRCRLIFTFMRPHSPGAIAPRHDSRLLSRWLARSAEPLQWGLWPESAAAFLAERGFSLGQLADADTLRRRYLTDPRVAHLRLARFEHIAIADRQMCLVTGS